MSATHERPVRLRVLFITRKWPPAVGGMENYCRELTAELRGRVDLTVRALPGRSDGMPPGPLSLLRFGVATLLYLLIVQHRFDVIHIGDMALWPCAAATRLVSRRRRLVATAHGSDVAYPLRSGPAARLYGGYLRAGAVAAGSMGVIANSRATAVLCREAGFRSVSVIPLGVRTADVASELPPPADYVLFVGRLVQGKGCAWFIRHVLPKLDPALRLVVAATEWDPAESRALQADRVDFRGPVYGQQLTELRRRAVAVVVPNISCGGRYFEGFGLTALEAAADGGIALASAIGGLGDSVIDGETGFLLPAEDPPKWADKIHEVWRWPLPRRREFIVAALRRVAQDYAWSGVADRTLGVYSASASSDAVATEG